MRGFNSRMEKKLEGQWGRQRGRRGLGTCREKPISYSIIQYALHRHKNLQRNRHSRSRLWFRSRKDLSRQTRGGEGWGTGGEEPGVEGEGEGRMNG